jgi:hypothetical protein
MEIYQTRASQPQSYTLPSRPARTQNTFDSPWTPVDPRMPFYPTGFTAFAPSPGPNGELYARQGSASAPSSPEASKPSPSPEKRPRSGRTSAKGKEKDRSTGWEHIVVAKNGLHLVTERPMERATKKSGVRTGGLDPQAKEKARRIRQLRACWNCWVQKVPVSVFYDQRLLEKLTMRQCSEGKTCDRCRKQFSPAADQLCCRSGFKDYESLFFPGSPCHFVPASLRSNVTRIHALTSPEERNRRPYLRAHRLFPRYRARR